LGGLILYFFCRSVFISVLLVTEVGAAIARPQALGGKVLFRQKVAIFPQPQ